MIEEDYKFKTTYWRDFSIADKFGVKAVRDAYRRIRPQAELQAMDFAELVLVLNWKIWEHYKSDSELANTYNDLWTEADNMIDSNHFSRDDLHKMIVFLD